MSYCLLYFIFSATLQSRFNKDLLSPELPERDVFEVILEKEPKVGIGLTIVGGENAGKLDLGIFIKSVTCGGPAERDGRIRPGDRLVAINNSFLEGLQHHDAVKMIRESKSQVTLLISQVRPPGSIRRRDYDEIIVPSKLRGSNASPNDVHIYRENHTPLHFNDSDIQIVVENTDDNYDVNIPQRDRDGVSDNSNPKDGYHSDNSLPLNADRDNDVMTTASVSKLESEKPEDELPRHIQNGTLSKQGMLIFICNSKKSIVKVIMKWRKSTIKVQTYQKF